MKRSQIILIAGVLVAVAGTAGALYLQKNDASAETSATAARIDSIARGQTEGSGESSPQSDVAVPVEGVPAVQDTMVIAVTAAGNATAWRQVKVSALVPGELKQLPVRESGAVSAGTLLAVVDPVPYQLSVGQAEASLRQAEARFQAETLFDDRMDAATRAQRQKAARANTGLDAAELGLEKAKLDLNRTRSTAPFAARVANVMVVPGQYVNAGTELMTLVDISRIKVEVQVLESEVALLSPGRGARVLFSAFPGEVFTGRIESINPMVDRATRFTKVVVSLPNPGGRILDGMYARVALDARHLPDRIIVPRSAILERNRRKMLFVFEGEGTRGLAKWRYVTTGAENDTMVELVPNPDTEMVKPGEIVLTNGHHTLSHDARIRVVERVAGAEGARQ